MIKGGARTAVAPPRWRRESVEGDGEELAEKIDRGKYPPVYFFSFVLTVCYRSTSRPKLRNSSRLLNSRQARYWLGAFTKS